MFDWLVDEGICRPDKAKAVQRWAALAHCRRHREIWPASLFAGDGAPDRRATSCIVRYLHHVKIVSAPDGPLEAKAYLACLHRFIPDRVIKEILRNVSARQEAFDDPPGASRLPRSPPGVFRKPAAEPALGSARGSRHRRRCPGPRASDGDDAPVSARRGFVADLTRPEIGVSVAKVVVLGAKYLQGFFVPTVQ